MLPLLFGVRFCTWTVTPRLVLSLTVLGTVPLAVGGRVACDDPVHVVTDPPHVLPQLLPKVQDTPGRGVLSSYLWGSLKKCSIVGYVILSFKLLLYERTMF